MIRAVLFDKDGTLVDFQKTWLPVARKVVWGILHHYELEEETLSREMLAAIGVFDDRIEATGSMAQGTNRDVALDFLTLLKRYIPIADQEAFVRMSTEMFDRIASEEQVAPTEEGLEATFQTLKDRGLIIGLATADTEPSARNTLEQLGLASYFQFIGADNGQWAPKPSPEMMSAFCQQFKLSPGEVAMVGDTPTDLNFGARGKAGCLVGVLCGTGTREELEPLSDVIIERISDIIDERGTFIWNRQGV